MPLFFCLLFNQNHKIALASTDLQIHTPILPSEVKPAVKTNTSERRKTGLSVARCMCVCVSVTINLPSKIIIDSILQHSVISTGPINNEIHEQRGFGLRHLLITYPNKLVSIEVI